jgi:hypothetical protein
MPVLTILAFVQPELFDHQFFDQSSHLIEEIL